MDPTYLPTYYPHMYTRRKLRHTNFCTITKPIIMGDEILKLLTFEWDSIKRGETYHDVLP